MGTRISGFISILLITSLLSISYVQVAVACTEEPFVTDLIAGGGNPSSAIDVGDVIVWNDRDYLYVKYVTAGGWFLTETHLHIATALKDIPQKNGNPIPGKFDYKSNHNPPVTEYTYKIPLSWHTLLYIAAHAKVIKLIGSSSSWQWATQIVDCVQGTLVGGGPITDPARIDPTVALGAPDGSTLPPATGFYSLGFVSGSDDDGYIVLGFGHPIYNGPNPDLRTVEITWGRPDYPREAARVYAIVGTMEYYLGTVTNHDNPDGTSYVSFDVVPAGLHIDAIKLVDDTYRADFTNEPSADGFDLDAVGVQYLYETEETAWGAGKPFCGKNWATYFEYRVWGCQGPTVSHRHRRSINMHMGVHKASGITLTHYLIHGQRGAHLYNGVRTSCPK